MFLFASIVKLSGITILIVIVWEVIICPPLTLAYTLNVMVSLNVKYNGVILICL